MAVAVAVAVAVESVSHADIRNFARWKGRKAKDVGREGRGMATGTVNCSPLGPDHGREDTYSQSFEAY